MQNEQVQVPSTQAAGASKGQAPMFCDPSFPSTQVFDRLHDKFFKDLEFQRKVLSKGMKARITVNNDQNNVDYYLQLLTVDSDVHPKQIVTKSGPPPNGLTDVDFQISDSDLSAVVQGKAKLYDLYENGKLKLRGSETLKDRRHLDDLDDVLNV